jgi:hypothetical protein
VVDEDDGKLALRNKMAGQEPPHLVPWPADEPAGVLRIGEALKAAYQDDGLVDSPYPLEHAWPWIVKPFPRPPLVAVREQMLDCEELLSNDSLGG